MKIIDFVSLQVWFKNRRAKCRQQLQHQSSSSVSSSKSSSNSASSGNRHSSSNNNSSSGNTNNSKTSNSTNSSNTTSANKSNNHMKTTSSGSNNNNNNATNNNSSSNNNLCSNANASNGLANLGQNASPILPMTPSTSVSPPINVICKKEVSSYHNSSNGSLNDVQQSLKSSAYDALKESDLGIHHTSAYANINARLQGIQVTGGSGGGGGGGNLTPLGSNSSIMTTPSPPATPQASHNALSYVPNHESTYGFWHNQYNNYPPNNAYNASYAYTQMEYFPNQSQSNYANMGHGGYASTNFGLSSGTALTGAMGAQGFGSPNLEYMSPQDKYANMV